MQPYFFPYLGYFQLINEVHRFVVYDNLKYTKKGWINRNQILVDGKANVFSLPLKKDSNLLFINQRQLAKEYSRMKLLNKIYGNYSRAPFFNETFEIIRKIVEYPNNNLFLYILNSIRELCGYLMLQTNIQISSDLPIDHSLKGKEKVIAICKSLNGNFYVNPISGKILYDKQSFFDKNIQEGIPRIFIMDRKGKTLNLDVNDTMRKARDLTTQEIFNYLQEFIVET